MFLVKGIVSLGVIAGGGYLFLKNPALGAFTEKAKSAIGEEQGTARAGLAFGRRVTGVAWLKQKTHVVAHEACSFNLYVGSLYVVKRKAVGSADELIAFGIGAAGKVHVGTALKEPLLGMVSAIPFSACEPVVLG